MNDAAVFWHAVAASVAATPALSTGLAWAIGNWARNRSRAEADWIYELFAHVVDEHSNEPHLKEGQISIRGKFANAGDASAFRLFMKTSSGKGGLSSPTSGPFGLSQQHPWIAVLEPGKTVDFWAAADREDWEDFVVTLDWISPPTRLKKHLQFELKPSLEFPNPLPVAVWTENGLTTDRPVL